MAPPMNCYCKTKTLHMSAVFDYFLKCKQDYLENHLSILLPESWEVS